MTITGIWQFWFDSVVNAGNDEQRNMLTVQIPNVNIVMQSSITAFGGGVNLEANVAGSVGIGVREWVADGNDSGVLGQLLGHVILNNCTSITMELGLILATATASGMIFAFEW